MQKPKMNFMQILNTQQNKLYTDQEYLTEYIQAFYRIYTDEIACVRNIKSQYIAATDNFAKLVGVDPRGIIMKTDKDLPRHIAKYAQIFYKYDKIVWTMKKQITCLDINEYANGIGVYVFYKKPIINPHTGKVLGILYLAQKYKANNMVKTFLDMHKNTAITHTPPDIINTDYEITLGVKQSEILFCMTLGLKEDKVIADFINQIKGSSYTNATINNAIKELYKKFSTNSRDGLIQLAFTGNYHLNVPKTLIKYGTYLMDSTSLE
ncbi:MAG: hypothetical protein K0R49_565 [Burkholderiales bacterium]|jgi:hypothetical protein|nr:hypothetical protein [Burkholderiales bacterium]MCE3268313.1 hypothetical protein [Burkholderiales bacterium]